MRDAYRHRERQVATILARRGLAHLLSTLGLERLVPLELGALAARDEPEHTKPGNVRLALEELGPTFMKLGQILSTRADLLPAEYRAELVKLEDRGPRIDPAVIKQIVDRELPGGHEGAFATFDFAPLATASIGQAHTATLHDGTEVVVKVQRPEALDEVDLDLEILRNMAVSASKHWQEGARMDLVGVAEELAMALRAELDYLHEADNAERIAANFAGEEHVLIPRVFRELTTSMVITLERIRGMKITDFAALDAAGLDRDEIARRATQMLVKMVFEDGFFHADPHPGNFLITETGRIGLLDFGRVGVLDDDLREQMRRLFVRTLQRDPDGLARLLITLGVGDGVDRGQLRHDIAVLLQRHAPPGGDLVVAGLVADLLEVVRRHHLRVPRDLALLLIAIVMEEAIAAEVAPDFRVGEVLAPYARRLVASELSPAALARRVEDLGVDLATLATDLPQLIRNVLEVIGGGSIEVHIRAEETHALLARAERLSDRLAASAIFGAVIVAGSQLVAADRVLGRSHPEIPRAAGLGMIGSAALYGAWRIGSSRLRRRTDAGQEDAGTA